MPNREADLEGPQRKVLTCAVHPARSAMGDEGIPLRGGTTLPFVVSREWSAPAGHYPEAWYLIDPSSREVLYEGPVVERHIWGLQSATRVIDRVTEPIPLEPGSYQVVFALGGLLGGEFDVEAVEVSEEEAA